MISPHVIFCLVKPEILVIGIRNPTDDWNLESKFHWQRLESNTWNLESMTWNPESKTLLDSLTWGECLKYFKKKIKELLQERHLHSQLSIMYLVTAPLLHSSLYSPWQKLEEDPFTGQPDGCVWKWNGLPLRVSAVCVNVFALLGKLPSSKYFPLSLEDDRADRHVRKQESTPKIRWYAEGALF